MCGIIGVIGGSKDLKLNPSVLAHRGPDATGIWISPDNEHNAILAHTRLAILDLSETGNQPLIVDDRYVFIYNGEIYNFVELRSQFEKKGHIFKTQTDTEVFLRGLIEEGPSFQLRCNGMWSFCLWDRKAKVALFGRDRFGKKPLFYSLDGNGRFVFASEMKGIYPYLSSVQPSEKINLHIQRLFDYESSESCVIKGINRIPPGHFAVFQNGKLDIKRWWNTLDHLEEVPNSYDDQVERWRELFLDAVKIRMRSDVRIGTALSGGLDSSATFCAMAYLAKEEDNHDRCSNDWQHGFCAHYPGSSLDESKWARLVTDSIGVQLEQVSIDPLNAGWSISDSLFQVEEPYLTLPLPMLATYRAISKAGIKVTLDGHGADELFSGYGHLSSAFRSANPKQAADLSQIINSLLSGNYRSFSGNIYANWARHRLIEYLKELLRIPKQIANALINKSDIEFIMYKLEYYDQSHPNFKKMDALSKNLYEIFHITTLPTLLRNYDRYSMASGVEIRMPFMDYRLVTNTFSLPWTSKVGGTYTKRIMRDALKGIVPEEIRTRRDKVGWNAPLHEWFKGPLRDEIEIMIATEKLSPKFKKTWENFQSISNPGFNDGQKMWSLLMPTLWRSAIFKSL